jgi:hypothetical protein
MLAPISTPDLLAQAPGSVQAAVLAAGAAGVVVFLVLGLLAMRLDGQLAPSPSAGASFARMLVDAVAAAVALASLSLLLAGVGDYRELLVMVADFGAVPLLFGGLLGGVLGGARGALADPPARGLAAKGALLLVGLPLGAFVGAAVGATLMAALVTFLQWALPLTRG